MPEKRSMQEIVDEIHKDCPGPIYRCDCVCGCEAMSCDCFMVTCTQCYMDWVRDRDTEVPHRPAWVKDYPLTF